MAIRLPLELEELNFIVGADFPAADEDALWRCGLAWASAACELRRLEPEAIALGRPVVEALSVEALSVEVQSVEVQSVEAPRGEVSIAFADMWRRVAGDADGFINQLATACERLAEACNRTAQEVEYAKIQYIGALIVLGVTIASLLAMVWAGGISAGGIPIAIAAANVTIRVVLVRLLTAVAFGAGLNVALDGLAQAIQLSNRHRETWDWTKTRRAAEDGAVFGVAGAGVFLAGGRLAPGLIGSPSGLLSATGVTGAVGGIAAPLAHGEMPTGRDFLMAVSSGLVGGLGPDLARRPAVADSRVPAPDLSRLTTLDPGLPSSGVDGDPRTPQSAPKPASVDAMPPRPRVEEVTRASEDRLSTVDLLAGDTGRRASPPDGGAGRAPADPAAARLDRATRESAAADLAALGAPRGDAWIAPGYGTDVAPATSGVTSATFTPAAVTSAPFTSAPFTSASFTPAAVTSASYTSAAVTSSAVTTPAAPIHPGDSADVRAAAAAATLAGAQSPSRATSGPIIGSGPLGAVRPETPTQPPSGTGPDSPMSDEPSQPTWELTEAEAVELVRSNVFETEAGLAFYPVGDEIRDFARAVNPAPGYVTLDLHGSPTGFLIDDYMISPEQFSAGLRALCDSGLLRLPAGGGIKLLSCDTAVGGSTSPAAVLARELGVEVVAPDQPVWTTMDGEEIVASPVLLDGNLMPADPPDGDWHRFSPAGEDISLGADRGSGGLPRGPDPLPDVVSRRGLDPGHIIGRDPIEIMAEIPSDWTRVPSRSGGGVVFRDPDCPGRQIRIMPGYTVGNRPDPVTHGPYATISQDGMTVKVPLFGNPTLDGSDG